MKPVDPYGLPQCLMSAHCLRLIDDLDHPGISQQLEQLAFTSDVQEERFVEELRAHISTCPTCTSVLAHARRVRTQQRTMLYNLLLDSERKVPSTTKQVSAAIHREQRASQANKSSNNHHRVIETLPTVQKFAERPQQIGLAASQSQTLWLRNALALVAVAVIILAAVGIFNRNNFMHIFTGSSPTPHGVTTNGTNGWDYVAMSLIPAPSNSIVSGEPTIFNYEPKSGKSASLVQSTTPSTTRLDGVSHDGLNLLYQVPGQSGQTLYYTLSRVPTTGYFYALNDSDAGNAIWMTDSRHVLISTIHNGVKEVDTLTGQFTTPLPALKTAGLTFFRDPYLYFIGTGGVVEGALYRVNIAGGQPVQVSMRSPGSTFWLSPDGSTVFYANKGSAGVQGIYAVGSDGTNSRLLRGGPGIPVGYAADNALMLLQMVNGKFELVKLGTKPQQPEQVIFNDVAPNATSLCRPEVPPGTTPICESNVALAPYAHGLIVHAFYADGTSKVVYDDLTDGTSHTLLTLNSNTLVQLPGWDRIPLK